MSPRHRLPLSLNRCLWGFHSPSSEVPLSDDGSGMSEGGSGGGDNAPSGGAVDEDGQDGETKVDTIHYYSKLMDHIYDFS